jgi:diaminohydroxyphosphoribosylaminopyrimidine deaminase / 5-amino-6-(5-phosphoribosylamino)uracil reductase
MDDDRYMDDDKYMEEAFDLADYGRGSTHPNPLVGAVLVRDGEVMGRGYHLGPGRPHAEGMALGEAGERAAGATMYVTLEPCSHQGLTPPCADALIAAGVTRVVVALGDPDPRVNGQGIARLQAAGIEVDLGDDRWGPRARQQNAAFLKFQRTALPLITYKAAVTLDGKVAAAGGDARWISCLDSRRIVHQLRAGCDAVMVGAGTVRRDDPELTVRLSDGDDPVRVIVTRYGDLPPEAKVLTTAEHVPTIVVVMEEATPAARHIIETRGAELVELHGAGLPTALATLASRGLLDVLCEGGPVLAGSLLSAGLVDRVAVFVAPLIMGRGAPDLFAAPAVDAVAQAWHIHDVEWRAVCDDLLLMGWLRPQEER